MALNDAVQGLIAEARKQPQINAQQLFTTFIPEFEPHWPLLNLLAAHGFDTENRRPHRMRLPPRRVLPRK